MKFDGKETERVPATALRAEGQGSPAKGQVGGGDLRRSPTRW